MRVGKISENILKRSILKQINNRRKELLKGANVGSDSSLIQFNIQDNFVITTNPIIGELNEISDLVVYHVINDIAASKAEPIGVLISLLLPEDINEKMLKESIITIEHTCKELNIDILGGHTEVTPYVLKPIINISGVGMVKKDTIQNTVKVKDSDDIILTKWIGLEGTLRIARKNEKELLSRYNQRLINQAKSFNQYLSIIKESKIALQYESYMHNVSTGGIYASLWELSALCKMGFEVDLNKIHIKQETIEICEFYKLNPYKLLSNGSLLITTNQGQKMIEDLTNNGIIATKIGKIIKGNDKIIIHDDKRTNIEPSKGDEWYKVMYNNI